MLQAFKQTNKQCGWTNKDGDILCTNIAVKSNLPITGKTKFCLKHQLYMYSGRVGVNYKRDNYREHLSPSRIDFQYVISKVRKQFPDANWKDCVRYAVKCFEADHIDGNKKNNNPSNIQTLDKIDHMLKSMKNGDLNGWKNKSKKS